MPQPPAYTRQFDFTQHEAENPADVPPGVSLDAEFNALVLTAAAILANLVKLQRDDGALKNSIVTMDALSPAVILTLGAGSQWTPRGDWATATAYAVSDVVESGTATFVCPVAHVSGDFATDRAAGKWILIFDSAGAVPADGSVTSAKLADGAVKAEHVGFVSLDLTGSIRGQGGIAAGTAPIGALLHAKKAAGDVHAKVERTTDAQGLVGYQVIGVGATWMLQLPVSSNNLTLNYNGTDVAVFYSSGVFDYAGTVRACSALAANAGVQLTYAASIGTLASYDNAVSQWRDLRLRGKDVYIDAGGVNVAKATSTYIDFLKEPRLSGVPMGYLGIPQVAQNGSFALDSTYVGKAVYSENAGGQTITLPNNVFDTDDVFLIINDGTGAITLDGGTSVVLRFAGGGTANNATIGAGGMAWVKCVKANRYFVRGDGVSAA